MAIDASVILREGVLVAIKLCGPILILTMVVGIVVAIFQAVTQIHDQTLAFVLKMVVVILVLLIGGKWMLNTLEEYTQYLFTLMT